MTAHDTLTSTPTIKQQLYSLCANVIQQRIENAQQALKDAEESAAEETKSSAGDKYETGREMLQQDKDRSMTQIMEGNKLLNALKRIGVTGSSAKAIEGSVVITNNGNFYLSVSAGTLQLDGKTYVAVSTASPIGAKLMGCTAGNEFALNGKTFKVIEVE